VSELNRYALSKYAAAEKQYWTLITERDEVIESLYEDAVPSVMAIDPEEGRMYRTGFSTEDMAILIISEKDLYEARISKEERKAVMFNEAMKLLSEEEREAVKVRYQGEQELLNLPLLAFRKALVSGERKLMKAIGEARQHYHQEKTQQEKAARIQKVKNFALHA
jgi:hypothetical protein